MKIALIEMTRRAATPATGLAAVLIVSAGHFLVDFYGNLLLPLLPLISTRLDLNLAMAGGLISAAAVTNSVAQPFAGLLCDRFGRGWMMPAAVIWGGVLTALFGYAGSYGSLMGVAALAGLGSAFYHPLGSVGVTEVAGERKATAISVYSTFGNLGYALGPAFVAGGGEPPWAAAGRTPSPC